MQRGIGRLRARASGFNPASLFAAGEQGAWYDPSDFSSEYQESTGATQVTAIAQTVGMLLDKRQGLARGSELAPQTSSTAGWTPLNSAGLSSNGTLLTVTSAGASSVADGSFATVVGQWYEFTGVCTGGTGDQRQIRVGTTAGNTDYGQFLATGTFRCIFKATGATCFFRLFCGDTVGMTGIYGPLSTKAVGGATGNHLLQATAGSRPIEQQPASFLTTKSDGLDDFLATTSGGGGTAGFFYCAAINPSAIGANQTLWADTGTNTGYRVRLNSSNQLELAAGNNVAFTTAATVATVTTGTTYVVMAWHDGVNLSVQINSNTVGTAAFGTTTAGTAAFTDAASNGGASGFFNGYLFNRVYKKDSGLTSAQRAQVQQFIANGAGVTL